MRADLSSPLHSVCVLRQFHVEPVVTLCARVCIWGGGGQGEDVEKRRQNIFPTPRTGLTLASVSAAEIGEFEFGGNSCATLISILSREAKFKPFSSFPCCFTVLG